MPISIGSFPGAYKGILKAPILKLKNKENSFELHILFHIIHFSITFPYKNSLRSSLSLFITVQLPW